MSDDDDSFQFDDNDDAEPITAQKVRSRQFCLYFPSVFIAIALI